jgi:hypothetical protein
VFTYAYVGTVVNGSPSMKYIYAVACERFLFL